MKMIQLGKYRLIKKLFELYYGEVWKALSQSNKEVIVEIFDYEISQNESIKYRLSHYANNLFYLVHPNIFQLIDTGYTSQNRFYIVYESGRVKSLYLMMEKEKGKAWELEFCCYVITKICEAIDYAHTRRHPIDSNFNFVHGSISPKKIFIDQRGEVKIYDFNTINAISSLIRPFNLVDEGYKAPEHFLSTTITSKTDIFLIGTLLYHLLTGKLPFGEQKDWKYWKEEKEIEAFSSELNIPKELETVIKRALSFKENPYNNVGELLKELNEIVRNYKLTLNRKELKYLFNSIESEFILKEEKERSVSKRVRVHEEREDSSLEKEEKEMTEEEEKVSEESKEEREESYFKHDSALIPVDMCIEEKPQHEEYKEGGEIDIVIEEPVKLKERVFEASPWIKFFTTCILMRENPQGVKYLFGNSEPVSLQRDLLILLEKFVESLYYENKLCVEYLKNDYLINKIEEEKKKIIRIYNTLKEDITSLLDDYITITTNKEFHSNIEELKKIVNSFIDKQNEKLEKDFKKKILELQIVNEEMSPKVINYLEPLLVQFPISIREAELFYSIAKKKFSIKVDFLEDLSVDYLFEPIKQIPKKIKELEHNLEIRVGQKRKRLLKSWCYKTELIDQFIIEKLQFRSTSGQLVIVSDEHKKEVLIYNLLFLYTEKGIKVEIYKQYDINRFEKIEIEQSEDSIKKLLSLHNKLLSIIEDNLLQAQFKVDSICCDGEKVSSPLDSEKVFVKIASVLSPHLQEMIMKSSSIKEYSLKLEHKSGKREEKYIPREPIEEKIKEIQSSWKYILHLIGVIS